MPPSLLFCCVAALERCKFSLYIPPTDNCWLLKARLNSTLIPGKRSLRYPLSLRRFLWDLGCHIEIRRLLKLSTSTRPTLLVSNMCFRNSYPTVKQSRLRESRVVLLFGFKQHFDEVNGRMFSRLAGVGDVEAGAVARLVRRARRTRPLRERQVRRLRHRRGNDY